MGTVHAQKLHPFPIAITWDSLAHGKVELVRMPQPFNLHIERTSRSPRTKSQKNLERKPTKKAIHGASKMLIRDSVGVFVEP